MKSLSFFASGIPKGQPRPRAFARKFGDKWQARVYDAGTAENWKSQIAQAWQRVIDQNAFGSGRVWKPIEGPVSVRIRFNFPRPKAHLKKDGSLKPGSPYHHTSKPDIENCEKAVLDALTQLGAWRDDSQVCELHSLKFYETLPTNVGAHIEIQQLEALNG